jgi:hypothetical protein
MNTNYKTNKSKYSMITDMLNNEDIAEEMMSEGNKSVQEKYDAMYDTVFNIASGTANYRHCVIYGDPGIGKTHDCKLAGEKGVLQNPFLPEPKRKRFIFKSGSSGSAPSALIGLLY